MFLHLIVILAISECVLTTLLTFRHVLIVMRRIQHGPALRMESSCASIVRRYIVVWACILLLSNLPNLTQIGHGYTSEICNWVVTPMLLVSAIYNVLFCFNYDFVI